MISELCQKEIYKLFQYFIKNYPNFLEVIFNIILVCHGVRPSFLYEESNFYDNVEEPTKLLETLIEDINENTCLHLKTKKDNSDFTRIFVYLCESSRREVNKDAYPVDLVILDNPEAVNDDNEIAQMLGFMCVGHNYSSDEIDRIVINISLKSVKNDQEVNLKTEVCEKKKFDKMNREEIEDILNSFQSNINEVVKKYKFECFYTISITYSSENKLRKLKKKDLKFIEENLYSEYINDLGNYYISDIEELERSTTYKKFVDIENTIHNKKEFKLLLMTYEMAVNREFESYYERANTYDKIKKVARELADEDIEIWEKI